MGFFLSDCVGERFRIDEIDVPSNTTEIPYRARDGRFECPVVTVVEISSRVDGSLGMDELDHSPRRVESAGRSGGHACERSCDLRDDPCLREFAFKADITNFARTQK